VSHLHEGLKIGLEGSLEKFSDVLGRNAVSSSGGTSTRSSSSSCCCCTSSSMMNRRSLC